MVAFCGPLLRISRTLWHLRGTMPEPTPDEPTPQGEGAKRDKIREKPEKSPEGNPFGELIFRYSRAEALSDGVLIDVSETAKETGFRIPVALTRAENERRGRSLKWGDGY